MGPFKGQVMINAHLCKFKCVLGINTIFFPLIYPHYIRHREIVNRNFLRIF